MPLFMDIHKSLPGATVDDVVNAHEADLSVQDRYGTRYITYWFNEDVGRVFCLVEAPSMDAAVKVHEEAHGILADDIIEVHGEAVDAMLNIRHDQLPNGQTHPETGSPDGGFRTIMFTDLEGSTERNEALGDQAMMTLITRHNAIIRECLHVHGGREVKHTGDGMMASFVSVSHAVECSIAIQRAFAEHNRNDPDGAMYVRIGLSAGEPIENDNDLFGSTVNLAKRVCDAGEPGKILTTNVVRELCLGKRYTFEPIGVRDMKGFSEPIPVFAVLWAPD